MKQSTGTKSAVPNMKSPYSDNSLQNWYETYCEHKEEFVIEDEERNAFIHGAMCIMMVLDIDPDDLVRQDGKTLYDEINEILIHKGTETQ